MTQDQEADMIKRITDEVMVVLEKYPFELSRKAIDIMYLTGKTMDNMGKDKQ